jgi:pimeloyl-ACP methyl ester carboxylesterase
MARVQSWLMAAAIALALAGAAAAQDLVGEWHATLANATSELRLGLEITAKPGGGYEGRMISPDQSPAWLPLDNITLQDGRLTIAGSRIAGRFEGQWDAEHQAWVGQWTQGYVMPLVLLKGKAEPRLRPQTPKPPFPYRAEDVSFGSAPGVRVAGTLTLPEGKGPFPAAILLNGSGAQDRDESFMGHKAFLLLADTLTRRGIAVLRTDDRGFGKSTGDFNAATGQDFVTDAQAGIAYLRGRREIDGKRIGLIGHSEGGIIAPLVAAADPQVAFAVLLGAPGVPSRELLAAQREAVGRTAGLPPEAIAQNEATWSRLEQALAAAPDLAQGQADAAKVLIATGMPADTANATVRQVASPWYKWFIAYDPRPALAKLRIPVLAMNGEKDVQVSASQNLPAIREALKADPEATVIELPGLNHLFQTAPTGAPVEYARIEETMAPSALNMLADWVATHAGQ